MRLKLISIVMFAVVGTAIFMPGTSHAAGATPTAGLTFNNVAGTHDQQYAITYKITRAIDSAPAGSTIRMALFSGNVASFGDSVVAAHKRGVNVRMVIDGHSATSDLWKRLSKELGTNTSYKSFATVCAHGCFDTHASTYQHSKFYTFSQAGSAKSVVMVSSGNPTSTQAEAGWNNMYTIVENATMYKSFYSYFDAMAQSASKADNVDYYRSASSGVYTSILSPSQSSKDPNYYSSVLDNIHCNAASGYGLGGKTVVRVIMSLWNASRIDDAKRLIQLDNAGCYVQVIISAHGVSEDVQKILKQNTKNGGIELRNASRDLDGNGSIDRYSHEKVVMVSGNYNGNTSSKIIWVGSHNFTYNAFRGNNDVILRIASSNAYDTMSAHFDFMRKYAPRMKTSAAVQNRVPLDDGTPAEDSSTEKSVEVTPRADLDSLAAYDD